MNNFDRRYRLLIGHKGKNKGIELGAGDNPLRISFSLEKADTTTSNEAKIEIWNLNKEHRDMLEKEDCTVVLSAGYGKNLALAFCGNVTDSSTSSDGSDLKTEISVLDGLVEMRDTYISLSYKGTINSKKVISDIADKMGVGIVFAPKLTFKDFANGYSFIGQAKQALKKVCTSSGLSWTLQNGVLQIKSPGGTITNRVYVLNKDSGLIDIPKRVSKSAESKDGSATDNTKTESKSKDKSNSTSKTNSKSTKKTSNAKTKKTKKLCWEVKYLMNLSIGVNDFVKLESKYATGYFIVDSIKISGDTHGGDWTCTAQLTEVKI